MNNEKTEVSTAQASQAPALAVTTFTGGGKRGEAWINVWRKLPELCTRSKLSREAFCAQVAQIAARSLSTSAKDGFSLEEAVARLTQGLSNLGIENQSAVQQCWDKITVHCAKHPNGAPYILTDLPKASAQSVSDFL